MYQSFEPSQSSGINPENVSNFGFGDSFSAAPSSASGATNTQPFSTSSQFSPQDLSTPQQETDILADILPPAPLPVNTSQSNVSPAASQPSPPSFLSSTAQTASQSFSVPSGQHMQQGFSTATSQPGPQAFSAPTGQTASPSFSVPSGQLMQQGFSTAMSQPGQQAFSAPTGQIVQQPFSAPTGQSVQSPFSAPNSQHMQLFSAPTVQPPHQNYSAQAGQSAQYAFSSPSDHSTQPPFSAHGGQPTQSSGSLYGGFHSQAGSLTPQPPNMSQSQNEHNGLMSSGSFLPQRSTTPLPSQMASQTPTGQDSESANYFLQQGGSTAQPPFGHASRFNGGSFVAQQGTAAPFNSSITHQPQNVPGGKQNDVLGGLLGSTGANAPNASPYAVSSTGSNSVVSLQSKDKFATKSTVWADTLSRGLVNLNISGREFLYLVKSCCSSVSLVYS